MNSNLLSFFVITLLIFSEICASRNKNIKTPWKRKESVMAGKVVGGVQVPINMFPYVAAITITGRYICGGSIITERAVLTAAHCCLNDLEILDPAIAQIYVGATNWKDGVMYDVCSILPHERYTSEGYIYDIGIYLLAQKIKFAPTIRKIKIANDQRWRKTGNVFEVAGFGFVKTEGPVSPSLKLARMHYIDSKVCTKSHASKFMKVHQHMFCMIGKKWSGDCYGDSGTGILYRGNTLVGLVATGRDIFCASDTVPSMYTDVVYFRDWVYSNAKRLDSENSVNQCEAKLNGVITKKRREKLSYAASEDTCALAG